MAIFNSYVKLPEGRICKNQHYVEWCFEKMSVVVFSMVYRVEMADANGGSPFTRNTLVWSSQWIWVCLKMRIAYIHRMSL